MMSRQQGQSMTEFAIILPILLFLILGALQFIFIYQVKTTLNYATFEAARAGSLENAQIDAVQNGFSRAMAAYFTRPADDTDIQKSAAVVRARELVRQQIEDGLVRFERINPTQNSFDTFGEDAGGGMIEIPNSHLIFRDAGPTDNRGLSIQDANLLKIRITYCVDLIVPFANRIIETAAKGFTDSPDPGDALTCENCDAFEAQCMDPDDSTRITVVSHAIIRMQSPAQSCPNCFANTEY